MFLRCFLKFHSFQPCVSYFVSCKTNFQSLPDARVSHYNRTIEIALHHMCFCRFSATTGWLLFNEFLFYFQCYRSYMTTFIFSDTCYDTHRTFISIRFFFAENHIHNTKITSAFAPLWSHCKNCRSQCRKRLITFPYISVFGQITSI